MCDYCGFIHHQTNVCPTHGKVCYICRKLNHFARMCKSAREPRKETVVTEENSSCICGLRMIVAKTVRMQYL